MNKYRRIVLFFFAAAIIGLAAWLYCLQPTMTRAFEKASTKEVYSMTLDEKPFDMPYRLYLPEGEPEESEDAPPEGLPVFLWLCGSAQCGTDNVKQAAFDIGLVDSLVKSEVSAYKCIIIAPQIPKEPLAYDEEIIDGYMAIVESVQKKYNADTRRLYIAGFSMGGDEVWEIVERYPEKVAAAMPICAGITEKVDISRVRDVPTWMFHGALDLVYPVKQIRQFADKLGATDADIRYTEYRFAGHVCWHLAYREKGLLEWMFSQVKQTNP